MNKVATAYAVVGFLTFGYSYNADYRVVTSPYTTNEEVNAYSALAAGMCWPAYWLVKAFRPLRAGELSGAAR